jgi:hypothetical protein
MSAEAQKLVELTESNRGGGEGFSGLDVTQVLKDHPELMSGLNEYLSWRDDANKAIAETKQTVPIAHSIQKILNYLRKKKVKK